MRLGICKRNNAREIEDSQRKENQERTAVENLSPIVHT
jgi:hypothetical protein